jgi:16S rRNA (guanine527-N7)-methyltransferase
LPPEFGPEEFAHATGVSRETLARLKAFVGILSDWNVRHNLVSTGSLSEVWRRHILDSSQLTALIPQTAERLVDLGSGAGFPGLILAILLRERLGFQAVLYEATRKKCEFLEAAAAACGAPVEVRNARIEEASPEMFDAVTARACAPLSELLTYAQRFQGHQTTNLLLKGQSVDAELREATRYWKMRVKRHPSLSDPSGTILEIRGLARVR